MAYYKSPRVILMCCRSCNRESEALAQRTLRISHVRAAYVALAIVLLSGCAVLDEPRRVVPSYDLFTGLIVQLAADQNGDGRIDQWSYLDGARPLRGEADTDGDGRIDHWEYFDSRAAIAYVGASSREDGVEDIWTFAATTNGERLVARSRRRDRQIDRREYFRGDSLVRVEEDTDADGQVDKWDRYEGSVLREVMFDISLTAGRPDYRLLYDAQGRFEAIESDPERDGTFVRLAADTPLPNRPGGLK